MTDKYTNNPGLFSDEEMMKCEKGTLWSQATEEQKPVTCLGMTFPNDEERRAYFREELRKKLPELRQIEGFPIGEDDDIINLSDPPYYTACPNPWLNDFIAEWEKEKEQLKAEGKRSDDFEVKEPYASDVSEGKNNPVYVAHTYHTKVPHPAIMRYILHYTQPGDIVFDGFAGTGMTGVAAQACAPANDEYHAKIEREFVENFGEKPNWGARHAICGDLSPYASLIAYNYNTPVDVKLLKSETERIIKELKEEYGWMYETLNEKGEKGHLLYAIWSDVMACPNCGHEFVFWDLAIDRQNKCIRDFLTCPACGSIFEKLQAVKVFDTSYSDEAHDAIRSIRHKMVRKVYTLNGKRYEEDANDFDQALIEKIEDLKPKYWYPHEYFVKGSKTRGLQTAQGYDYYFQMFTKRNLMVIAAFLHKIDKSALSNNLKFQLTGVISRASKVNRIHISNYFHGGGGWNVGGMKGTFYIPNLPVENCITDLLEDRLSAFLRAYPYLPHKKDNLLEVVSASNVPIRSNSVDYIFVDPPFGANINYSELNSLPEVWLKVISNNNNEAIENPAQGKSKEFYHHEMQRCFSEFYRILKPGKWMTVEFSNTKAYVWNSIQNALQNSGFIIIAVSALDKKQGGMRGIVTTTAVRQDLAITCYKPTDELLEKFSQSEDKVVNVWDFIGELLQHLPVHLQKDHKTTAIVERSPKILFDRLIAYYVQHGYPVPMDAQAFQAGLRERYMERDGMFFTADQAAEYDEKKKQAPEMVTMGLIVSDEANGIEWLRNNLRAQPKTYQEIQPEWMQALGGLRKGDILPELKQILEENFIEEANGKWRLPNIQDEKDVEALRTKSLLREFKVYVEAAQKPKAKIKEARVEALRAGFKDCYTKKDFQTIVTVGDKIPQNLRDEDEMLLQYYDIAQNKL